MEQDTPAPNADLLLAPGNRDPVGEAFCRQEEGPLEAVERFLAETQDFAVDEGCEKFLMSWHPGGYLRRSPTDDRSAEDTDTDGGNPR